MSSPSSPQSPLQADPNRVAQAALQRIAQPVNPGETEELRYEHERPIRQKFRRLVDPGIVRDNSEADAKRVLLKLAENLLSDPENPKFREFKSTNTTIQRALIDPKGAIEFAIEMGFRATVHEFQPKYVWHSSPENLIALRVGRDVLKGHIELATSKEERTDLSQRMAKAEKTAAVQNVSARNLINNESNSGVFIKALLAFEDDRKRRKALDQRMKQDGYPTTPSKVPTTVVPPASPQFSIQGEGQTLGTASARRGFVHEDEDKTATEY
ncbi:PUB domain-containing protein [Rhizoctonia solani AG-1 IA]|uniref:PUB domain-containing protein n=1 Tax=Thanatephorus cucumeris (strain AG1-IA) TaxID=983506 RepID=L8X6B8_THACA|nr:PUB domain-containing protein [Rhizoctonia solani AG-1 IA]